MLFPLFFPLTSSCWKFATFPRPSNNTNPMRILLACFGMPVWLSLYTSHIALWIFFLHNSYTISSLKCNDCVFFCFAPLVPRRVFKTYLAKEKYVCYLLTWIENSNYPHGDFHVFETNLVYPAFWLHKGLCIFNNKKLWLWRSYFPSLSPKQCQGHLWEKVGGEAKLFAQSDKGAVPFPQNHRTDSLLLQIFGPLYPPHTSPLVINLSWKLSSVSCTNSNTWSSLISLFENNEVPQCYFKDLAAPVCPSPPTLFLGSSWS